MKSRSSLLLMELLVMILVFALVAGLCLQLFVKAGNLSKETARRECAFLMAQNAAEMLKATGGDFEKAQMLSQGEFRLEIQHIISGIPGLGQAEIRVYFEEDLLTSLCIGWQEAIP